METKFRYFQMLNANDLLILENKHCSFTWSYGFSTVFTSGMFWQLKRCQGQPTSPISVWHSNKTKHTITQEFFTILNEKTRLSLIFFSVQILFPFKAMTTLKFHLFPLTIHLPNQLLPSQNKIWIPFYSLGKSKLFHM